MNKKYGNFLIDITRNNFIPILNEFYTDKDKDVRTEFHIHSKLDMPILIASEGLQNIIEESYKKLNRATIYFEAATWQKSNPIGSRNFDALLELRNYEHKIIYDENNNQLAWFFKQDITKNTKQILEDILKKLGDKDIILNNPWKYFDINNVNFLKSTDKYQNYTKITNAKIKRFPKEFREMIGYDPLIEDNQIKITFSKNTKIN